MKFYDWNAKKVSEKDIEISFKVEGINQPDKFLSLFLAGKSVLEDIQDYLPMIWNLCFFLKNLLKKSK